MRTRAHLNDQIKQKIKKEYEEELKKKEYDQLMDKHLKHLDELEAEKQRLLKERALKIKELRDKQKREQYVDKRINEIKDKLYERDLVKQYKEEIRKAKEKKAAKKEGRL